MGAWIEIPVIGEELRDRSVAPLVGAWIEICLTHKEKRSLVSLPSWERGLKYLKKLPVVGSDHVAPLVGAWIEITECDIKLPHFLSLPSWERGLK